MAQKKVRGHRANKPNDSFGTINDEGLYRGKYRNEVYEDDDDNVEVEAQAEEQTEEKEEATSFVEASEEKDHDYKKRYDDLKRHYDEKIRSFKEREQEMEKAVRSAAASPNISLPKTPEELEKFKQEYPDVFDVVETIATLKAQERASGLEQELEVIREREKELKVQGAYRELMNNHPDFNEIKSDEKFLAWLDEQPETISDGIYKNNTDARWASRVLDLYKADMGITKKRNKSNEAAAAVVKSPKAKDISSEATGDKKIWKASQIAKMKPWEFEKHEAELDAARSEGRIDFQS
jgi:hypothetical protein